MEYTIIIEGGAGEGFSAFSPDVPGVVATGRTEALVRKRIASGIACHLKWLQDSGDPVPIPTTKAYKERIPIPRRSCSRSARKA